MIRDEAIHFIEDRVDNHDCGILNIICQFCGSINFSDERPSDGKFTSCCRKVKFKILKAKDVNGSEQEYPEFLRELMSYVNSPRRTHFREYIRSYNNAFSFASMGAKIVDLPGRSPYVFKVQGQTYHRTFHLETLNIQPAQYVQHIQCTL